MNAYYFCNKQHNTSWKEEGGGGERQAGDRKDGGLPPGLTHSPQIARTSRERGASVSGWISSGTRTSDSSTASG